mmetsp:Transcript_9608/g.23286  ORF Transcript_9608/g.23286 Transcript_9608/m.23286 type:complete len:247 (-) Transcript_9608:402-1142(-)
MSPDRLCRRSACLEQDLRQDTGGNCRCGWREKEVVRCRRRDQNEEPASHRANDARVLRPTPVPQNQKGTRNGLRPPGGEWFRTVGQECDDLLPHHARNSSGRRIRPNGECRVLHDQSSDRHDDLRTRGNTDAGVGSGPGGRARDGILPHGHGPQGTAVPGTGRDSDPGPHHFQGVLQAAGQDEGGHRRRGMVAQWRYWTVDHGRQSTDHRPKEKYFQAEPGRIRGTGKDRKRAHSIAAHRPGLCLW